MKQSEIIKKLADLHPAQFEELIFRLDIPAGRSPSPMQPPLERALEVHKWSEERNELTRLNEILADLDRSLAPFHASQEVADDLSDGTVIGAYKIEKCIGAGAFSKVYRARDNQGNLFAIKASAKGDAYHAALFRREAQLLRFRSIPGVSAPIALFSQGNTLFTVSELYDAAVPLEQWQATPRTLSELLSIYIDISGSIASLHRNDIVHRDIKPENILVPGNHSPLLIDFGLAQSIQHPDFLQTQEFFVGTVNYAAPEVFQGNPKIATSADIYSLGVMFYESLLGELPLESTEKGFVQKASRGEFSDRFYDQLLLLKPIGLADLIRSMLTSVPTQRPSAIEVQLSLKMATHEIERIKGASRWILPLNSEAKTFLRSLLAVHFQSARTDASSSHSNNESAQILERISAIERHLQKTVTLTESLALELKELSSFSDEQIEKVVRRSLVISIKELQQAASGVDSPLQIPAKQTDVANILSGDRTRSPHASAGLASEILHGQSTVTAEARQMEKKELSTGSPSQVAARHWRRLKIVVDSIAEIVAGEPKYLASIKVLVSAAQKLLAAKPSIEVLEDLDYNLSRIAEYVEKWRPTGASAGYIPPKWASDTDRETQEACRLLTALRSLPDELEVKEKHTMSTHQAVDQHSKASIFIGSSREGLPVAKALQVEMDYEAEITIWSQGVFGLSGGTLESLVKIASGFDFAILVLTPDDVIVKRDETKNAPRDNVLFELGLFIGILSRERTYIVHPRVPINLPSDLAGITPATYEANRRDGNLQAALGSVATKIMAEVKRLGRRTNAPGG